MDIQSYIDNFAHAPNSGVFAGRKILENAQFLKFKGQLYKLLHKNTSNITTKLWKAVKAAMRDFEKEKCVS